MPRCKQLDKLGAEVVEVSLPHTDYAIATYYIIATAEASANLARFDGIRYGARVEGADPIELYGKTRGAGLRPRSEAAHHPRHLRAEQRLLRRLLPPRAEGPHADPQRLPEGLREGGRHRHAHLAHRRLQDRREGRGPVADVPDGHLHHLLQPGGHLRPGVPCGFTGPQPRLPIGLQLLGKPFGEETILRIAHAYEQSTGWHKEKPPIESVCRHWVEPL